MSLEVYELSLQKFSFASLSLSIVTLHLLHFQSYLLWFSRIFWFLRTAALGWIITQGGLGGWVFLFCWDFLGVVHVWFWEGCLKTLKRYYLALLLEIANFWNRRWKNPKSIQTRQSCFTWDWSLNSVTFAKWELSDFPNQYIPIYHFVLNTTCTGTNMHTRHLVLRTIKSIGENTVKQDYYLVYKVKMIGVNWNFAFMMSYIDHMQMNWSVFWISGLESWGEAVRKVFICFFYMQCYRPPYQKRNLEIWLLRNLLHHQKVTQRLYGDLILLYSGNLTESNPGEMCFAKWQRNIYCFKFYLVRFLLTYNVSLSE